jgi:hypothetical protein
LEDVMMHGSLADNIGQVILDPIYELLGARLDLIQL